MLYETSVGTMFNIDMNKLAVSICNVKSLLLYWAVFFLAFDEVDSFSRIALNFSTADAVPLGIYYL